MHLKYCVRSAHDAGYTKHAQDVMRDLGLTYTHSTPQSMADQWWFWNVSVDKGDLSNHRFLSELDADPIKCIGWGLSPKEAKEIVNEQSKRV